MFPQAGHHALHHVAGDREADAHIAAAPREDGRVDADEFPAEVDQRPAGVTRIDGGIGLDEVLVIDDTHIGEAHGADDPKGHGLLQAERIPDRHDHLTNLEVAGVAPRQDRQLLGVNLDQGDVGLRIRADEPSLEPALVAEQHLDLIRLRDHVIVRHDVSARVDDHAGAHALLPPFSRFSESALKLITEKPAPELIKKRARNALAARHLAGGRNVDDRGPGRLGHGDEGLVGRHPVGRPRHGGFCRHGRHRGDRRRRADRRLFSGALDKREKKAEERPGTANA